MHVGGDKKEICLYKFIYIPSPRPCAAFFSREHIGVMYIEHDGNGRAKKPNVSPIIGVLSGVEKIHGRLKGRTARGR